MLDLLPSYGKHPVIYNDDAAGKGCHDAADSVRNLAEHATSAPCAVGDLRGMCGVVFCA